MQENAYGYKMTAWFGGLKKKENKGTRVGYASNKQPF